MTESIGYVGPSWSHVAQEDTPAVLILDDGPSLAGAVTLTMNGQRFVPYVVGFDTYPRMVRQAADRLNWDLHFVAISREEVRSDFIRLAEYGCVSRSQFEIGFALLHACAAVSECRIVVIRPDFPVRIPTALRRIAAAHGKTVYVWKPPGGRIMGPPANASASTPEPGTNCEKWPAS
jgi:hypothetical protein